MRARSGSKGHDVAKIIYKNPSRLRQRRAASALLFAVRHALDIVWAWLFTVVYLMGGLS